jgi:hypothetical protein
MLKEELLPLLKDHQFETEVIDALKSKVSTLIEKTEKIIGNYKPGYGKKRAEVSNLKESL